MRLSEIKAAKRILTIKKFTRIGLSITAAISVIFSFIALYAKNAGNYAIKLEDSRSRSMSLSETYDFAKPVTSLTAKGINSMLDIDGNYLNMETISRVDGSNNLGNFYIAYTFYLKNVGEETYDYEMKFFIEDVTKGVDSALRLRIYKDGVDTIYAKLAKDGNPEPGTIAFKSDVVAADEVYKNFKPGEIHKYTIVIYLHGPDPECVNDIMSGIIKASMQFSVIGL